jgi:hypothetical protein
MPAEVVRSGIATAIAVKPRNRRLTAALQAFAQDIARVLAGIESSHVR